MPGTQAWREQELLCSSGKFLPSEWGHKLPVFRLFYIFKLLLSASLEFSLPFWMYILVFLYCFSGFLVGLILIILKARFNVFQLYFFYLYEFYLSYKNMLTSLPYERCLTSGKVLLVQQAAHLNSQHGIFLEELTFQPTSRYPL